MESPSGAPRQKSCYDAAHSTEAAAVHMQEPAGWQRAYRRLGAFWCTWMERDGTETERLTVGETTRWQQHTRRTAKRHSGTQAHSLPSAPPPYRQLSPAPSSRRDKAVIKRSRSGDEEDPK
ncbi:hypothetical protein NDU88_004264 [Pleurodeles waltl]|uniref:Uncharacterized protein n=1 Tax=Pleurodeles waltl TaxID=8319 RepID=A0AAV7PBZ6_PLEWA|nr:hypothetical protein NDU88_004264 [Pleurodeles waltl]